MQQKKKNKRFAWPIILVLLVGLLVLLYPTISSFINERHQSEVIDNYQSSVSQQDNTALIETKDEATQFNAQLWQENGTSFSEYSKALQQAYKDCLNIDNGMMGYVRIPKIDVSLPIQHGTEETTLQNACGHMEGSSLPIGGANTHTVLSGHRGLPSSKLFTDLDQIVVGDLFYIYTLDETLAYQVDQISTVLPEQTESLGIVPGGDYATLITCTPYGINSHRLLVRGVRVPYNPSQEAAIEPVGSMSGIAALTWYLIAGTVIFIILILVLIPLHYKRKAEKGKNRQ